LPANHEQASLTNCNRPCTIARLLQGLARETAAIIDLGPYNAAWLSSFHLRGSTMISLEKHSDTAALIGRFFFSSMFLLFGYGKLTGYAGTLGYMGSLGLPAPALFTVLAIVIEIGAGLLVLVGYKTRLVSLGVAIYVLVSAFIGHSQLDDLNQFQHFMKNMAIVGGSLAFVAFGGGAYSLDARSRK
jgi:putative oxidoreductase